MVMKSEAEVREDLEYWENQYDNCEVEMMKPPIKLVITALKEVLGD